MMDDKTEAAINFYILEIWKEAKKNPMIIADMLCKLSTLILKDTNAGDGKIVTENQYCKVKLIIKAKKKKEGEK